jgi:hypothetical protein
MDSTTSNIIFVCSLIVIAITIFVIVWIYNIQSDTHKIKKMLFGLLYLKVKELKQRGEAFDIESIDKEISKDLKKIYEKGNSL